VGIERDHDAAAHWIDRSVRAGDADLAGIAREFAHDSFRLIGVLNVGLDLGLLSPALFSMMVIMALSCNYDSLVEGRAAGGVSANRFEEGVLEFRKHWNASARLY